jgi:hypothetical protein
MTPREITTLVRLARQHLDLAKRRRKQLAAERKADVERQLATIFRDDDQRWAAIVARAHDVVRQAEADIQAILDAEGVAKEFRPSLGLSWRGRGWNEDATRRAELRRVAYARIEADGQAARLEIDRSALDVQTELLADGLTSVAARAFLDAMPTPDALMPRIDVLSLDAARAFAGLVTVPEPAGPAIGSGAREAIESGEEPEAAP